MSTAGHVHERVVAPEAGEAAVARGLELVVALGRDALGELGEHVLDLESGHQPAQHRRQHPQVAHVGLDRLGDPRVLDLHRDLGALVRAPAVHLADARRGGRLGIDLGEDVLGRRLPTRPRGRRGSASTTTGGTSSRSEARRLLQVLRLVGIEAGELDRREHLPGLHRRAAHHRELVDERVDRRDHAVAAAALAFGLVAAGVEAVAGPAHRAAGRDPAERRGSRHPPAGRALRCRSCRNRPLTPVKVATVA